MPDAPAKLGAEYAVRGWQQPAILYWRHRWWSHRTVSFERLEQPNMEDVMETGALWQTKAIRHRANVLQHLEGAGIAWAELAGGAGL